MSIIVIIIQHVYNNDKDNNNYIISIFIVSYIDIVYIKGVVFIISMYVYIDIKT
jgi:hypothetical protein